MALTLSERSRLALAVLALFSLSLFLTDYSAKKPHVARVGGAVLDYVQVPFTNLYSGMYRTVAGWWYGYIDLIGVRERNEQLRKKLKALESQNTQLLEVRTENRLLRELVGLLDHTEIEGVAANVIGYDPSKWVRAAIIDHGSRSGVEVGMAVVDGSGVVGQVVVVSPSSARVQLITDHASGVDVIIQSSRARGMVQGLGGARCELRYVTADAQVAIGDRVLTSGLDGVYPKGLVVGVVSDYEPATTGLFHGVELTPAVDFARLEKVLVVTSGRERLEEVHELANSAGRSGR